MHSSGLNLILHSAGDSSLYICGSPHVWLQVLGDNLLALIKAYNYRGIPMPLLKRLTYQVCHCTCLATAAPRAETN